MIRFVIFASYGNDSVALIQWARENSLEDVAVVYCDTGWAFADWELRVDIMEGWVRDCGFTPYRTQSIGFAELARQKQGFPTQRYQWCSYVLKIEPSMRWLEENDPHKIAICVVGARRSEAADPLSTRANFPEYLVRSENHGGRMMLAPMVDWTAETRDAFVRRAGVKPLPHRSGECRCINSNKSDLQRYTEADILEIAGLEDEVGRPMFRPHRHMGATGIREIIKWANSPRGKYAPPEPGDEPEACSAAWCEA
ncbi:phosphoadenosine phosphosulfate reductase family protein [Bradyrhizobium sp. 33ap4]|uniref:phosphoadenosine phosphosulfate reductase domain-containing protein n=1 Tax=Bradyrhizobium sp. 33ap4 TaxID=3061630 RepID=UPI002931851A|nr:phosphoadenosine phosphosulfate reductase family protein [Bradyrhizobium sp. 33ap4]